MPTKAQLKQVAMPKTLLKEYHVVGRKVPVPPNELKKTPGDMAPQIFRMRIFAPNEVIAKSRYWYFMHQFSKAKKSTGEILTVNEVRERNSNVIKNFGIQIKYNSRSGTHNMCVRRASAPRGRARTQARAPLYYGNCVFRARTR